MGAPIHRGAVLTSLIVLTFLTASGLAQEPREKRREEILDDGTKIVHVTQMLALSYDRYIYAPDGSFKSHIGRESHPNGRWVCRRSYDEHGALLAFQTYTYDREWRPIATRFFNARGELVLYATSEEEGRRIFYTSDKPARRVVELGSKEYGEIVRRHHLEAFQ